MVSRLATADDIEEVVRLAGLMFASMGLEATDPMWLEEARAVAAGRLGTDLAAFVVDDPHVPGHLVSSAACSIVRRLPTPRNPTGLVGHVQWVATDHAHRRKGHGRAVMEGVLGWCSSRGLRIVELNATPEGEPLYRSLGFGDPSNPHLVAVLTS
ncbi:MAG TPA: GNAT family N-acetyltransferase [Acidimicrobiales bacterium]|jgi:GNAT superfamily N-acetyltransferase|nr:GNAT family N-acetyltransferase [Acidimicrobiales bacterium]